MASSSSSANAPANALCDLLSTENDAAPVVAVGAATAAAAAPNSANGSSALAAKTAAPPPRVLWASSNPSANGKINHAVQAHLSRADAIKCVTSVGDALDWLEATDS